MTLYEFEQGRIIRPWFEYELSESVIHFVVESVK